MQTKAGVVVGNPAFIKAAEDAQRRSLTLLKNSDHFLPLKTGALKIYIKNIDPKVAAQYGTIVEKPEDAQILRSSGYKLLIIHHPVRILLRRCFIRGPGF